MIFNSRRREPAIFPAQITITLSNSLGKVIVEIDVCLVHAGLHHGSDSFPFVGCILAPFPIQVKGFGPKIFTVLKRYKAATENLSRLFLPRRVSPLGAKEIVIIKSGDMRIGFYTSQPESACLRQARVGLQPHFWEPSEAGPKSPQTIFSCLTFLSIT
jgi:hypothetical protein